MDTGLPTSGHLLWRWLEAFGLNAKRRFAEVGLSRNNLKPHSKRIAIDKWEQIVADAISEIGESGVGLRVAQCWHPSDLGALGYAWMTSSTLYTALHRAARYIRIVGERASLALEETEQGLQVTLLQRRTDPLMKAVFADFVLALITDMCRVNYGASLRPVAVRLSRRQPACSNEYEEFFGCKVNFTDTQDSITLTSDDAHRVLSSANKDLAGVHDQILAKQLASLDRDNIVARCKVVILDNLTSGEVTAHLISRELHMSPRTLTRRLQAESIQLQTLIDDTRRQLAENYFTDRTRTVSEVAFLLGFSQLSSLTRASKRWFGMPPKTYRKAIDEQAAL